MSATASEPTRDVLNGHAFVCLLDGYLGVVTAFYRSKVKGDTDKHQQAIREDTWRYDNLPAAVKERPTNEGISKEELERLVKWKITHQKFRPFLLPQIRKNSAETVAKCTADARKILLSPETALNVGQSQEHIRKALDKVCELTGVGPATGTLILSVFDEIHVPFFEDELYSWLLSTAGTKLKYNVKEYFGMLTAFQSTKIPGIDELNAKQAVSASDFEKVAFVCKHWDLVSDECQTETVRLLEDHSGGKAETIVKDDTSNATEDNTETLLSKQKSSSKVSKPATVKRKATTGGSQGTKEQQSKRNKT